MAETQTPFTLLQDTVPPNDFDAIILRSKSYIKLFKESRVLSLILLTSQYITIVYVFCELKGILIYSSKYYIEFLLILLNFYS